jgi:hypothetical protein
MVTLLSTTVIKQFYEQKQLTLGERAVELLNVLLHGPPVGKPYYCMSGNPNNLCMSELLLHPLCRGSSPGQIFFKITQPANGWVSNPGSEVLDHMTTLPRPESGLVVQ